MISNVCDLEANTVMAEKANGCPIAHCHQNMFHAWAAFERREYGFLSELFQNFTDPFNSAQYREEFCRIFYLQQQECLHRCTDTELDHAYSTTIWSLNRRAEWFNYRLNFTPKGMLEHYLFRRKPDLYMKPAFLRYAPTLLDIDNDLLSNLQAVLTHFQHVGETLA